MFIPIPDKLSESPVELLHLLFSREADSPNIYIITLTSYLLKERKGTP